MYVKHVGLTKERNRELAALMLDANGVLLDKIANSKAKINRSQFRIELFKILDAKGINSKNGEKVSLHGVSFSAKQTVVISAVREVEFDIISNFSRLLEKHSRRFAQMHHKMNGVLEVEDFYAESYATAVDCVYGYNNSNVKFITYLTISIVRKCLLVINENRPFSHYTNNELNLSRKYYLAVEEEKQKQGRNVSFDEVVKMMDLSKDEISAVEKMLIKISSGSGNKNENEETSDYSSLRKISKEDLNFSRFEVDEKEAIERAWNKMSEWEQAVLEAYLDAPFKNNGWKTEVASKHINPSTGKIYSKAAPSLAMDRIKNKIKKEMVA